MFSVSDGPERVHLKCIMTQMTQLKEEHTYFTIANVQQIGFGSSCFSFVLRKGEWVISKSTEIFKELELRFEFIEFELGEKLTICQIVLKKL